MKIAIVSWYNKPYARIGDLTAKLNAEYADRHGYECVVSSERKVPKRKSNWEKLPILLDTIQKYDAVVWVDADAFFLRTAESLDKILGKYDTDAILSDDRPWTGQNPGGPDINSGVFILRNSPWCVDFLKRWLFTEDLYHRRIRPWEDQGVLRLMYQEDEDVRNHCSISPLGELQSFGVRKGLIAHMTDCAFHPREKAREAIQRYETNTR